MLILASITESANPNVPDDAVKFVPAIAVAKSAMLSFFELLSPASIIAMLSALTSTAAAVSSLRSSANETAPLVPPPLKPSPAVTASISPAEVVLVIVNVPAASSYDKLIPEPAVSKPLTASSMFSCVLISEYFASL